MGTRHLVCVVKDKEYKVAQYGQWDGYPSGQGQGVVDFIKGEGNIEKLETSLSRVRYLDYKDRDKEFIDNYNKNAPPYMSSPETRSPDQIKWFSNYQTRDLGAQILSNIAFSEDEEILLTDSIDFAKDSLFCEYAYIVNLDTQELEIYKGFNTSPLDKSERFYSEDVPKEYYPVRFVEKFSFDELKMETMAQLEKTMYPEDE
jgi:hypothetical protein